MLYSLKSFGVSHKELSFLMSGKFIEYGVFSLLLYMYDNIKNFKSFAIY